MPLKHNKKRNSGLLAEFFSRHIAECSITNKHSDITKAKKVWDKYFRSGGELQKELQLFVALNESKFSAREIAYGVFKQVRESASKISAKRLEKEKTSLIREINNTLGDPKFFNRDVDNYTGYATIQILLDSWINRPLQEGVINPAMSELEDQILEHMCKKDNPVSAMPRKASEFLGLTKEDIDGMVISIMTKKMNEKFSESLTHDQKRILQQFVFGSDLKKLSGTLSGLREETLTLISEELKKKGLDRSQKEKITQIKELLEGIYKDTSKIDDTNIIFYMSVSKLNEELKDEV